ncbi:aminodeoxychorismate synthase component I [Variovorax sp. KK3]|uniref:aminodeoxychorismate synthase component I n=1 Tax=Variovorax sp. KK3 TaxID=1855728 RepID=UPI00097C879F|nr:aminodeoxychorismate synthase component I [Variovorax sp. KK3]
MTALSALIDFSCPADPGGPRLRHAFGAPRETLVAHTPAQVRPLLDAVERHAQQGRWCVGYLRYEAASAFDPALAVHDAETAGRPLAWFSVHDEAQPWPDDAVKPEPESEPTVHWHESIPRASFDHALQRAHSAIAEGELYQVNYTALLRGELRDATDADAASQGRALFAALKRAQPGGYAAWIDTGDEQLLSVSPELFFDWTEGRLLARPMKGTAPRGATAKEDATAAARLRASAKERAENVMVVDLLRNDMSRVALPNSVCVPRLFHVEALPTVWQMTSDVQAHTRPGCTLADVFAALFPCGSVTGAPKVSAMRLIRALEPEARGIYCGAVGVVRPGGAATFNVPIRTVTLQGAEARCGIGSGITADAKADDEWQEWRHKRAFLDRASRPFELLETLSMSESRLRDGPAHLGRMAAAAQHFGYPWHGDAVAQSIHGMRCAHPHGVWRVRLLLDAAGRMQARAFAQDAAPPRVRLQLADRPFEAADSEFVRFKTTRRDHYEAFAPTRPGLFDTLLWNRRGEFTECTRGNVAFRIDGRWLTPPLQCGLLAGIGRMHWLREGRLAEGVVRVQDLPRVEALAFLNSLRGWIEAELEATAP